MRIELSRSTFWGWLQVASYACFVLIFVTQSVRVSARNRANPITLGARNKGVEGLLELLLFAEVNVWGLLVVLNALPLNPAPLQWLFRWRWATPVWLMAIGVVVILGAFGLFVLSLRTLNSSWRLGIDTEHPGKLVTRGIYAHSRNPIYLFLDLYFLGILLMNGSLVFALFLALTVGLLHRQALREEAFLARAFGPEYEAYRKRTGRYVTWPYAGLTAHGWCALPAAATSLFRRAVGKRPSPGASE